MIKRMISHVAMSPAEHLTAAAAQSDGRPRKTLG
jgi:hypothetical protein